jgi:protein phosphatase
MDSGGTVADVIISCYSSMIQGMDIEATSQGKVPLCLPQLSADDIVLLCDATKDLFSAEDVSLQLPGPVIIIGDLHGQILDLFRVLQTFGLPEQHNFLFLGDIVDRGEFSTETCVLVWALKVKYPKSVFIIRGNHEFAFLCKQCGFQAELYTIYGAGSRTFESFLESFSYMPLTAVIANKILCVHGGLGPSWYSLSQSQQIERPIEEFTSDLLDAMLWSDPSPAVAFFEPSTRGAGFVFGESALVEFLDSNGLSLLVRAHECVNTGCQFIFNDRLATVFGASNYGGLISNNSAVLEVGADANYEVRQFVPLQYLKRDHVKFGRITSDGTMVALSRQVHPPRAGLPALPRLPPLASSVPVFGGGRVQSARTGWSPSVKPPTAAAGSRSPRKIL